ncbi:hypothetical protein [Nostoc sp.]|uniref:hypothetical protein n=1 Tax=Nostoc sp. TaxID=1180 RepID=UPI002FFBDD11
MSSTNLFHLAQYRSVKPKILRDALAQQDEVQFRISTGQGQIPHLKSKIQNGIN